MVGVREDTVMAIEAGSGGTLGGGYQSPSVGNDHLPVAQEPQGEIQEEVYGSAEPKLADPKFHDLELAIFRLIMTGSSEQRDLYHTRLETLAGIAEKLSKPDELLLEFSHLFTEMSAKNAENK